MEDEGENKNEHNDVEENLEEALHETVCDGHEDRQHWQFIECVYKMKPG